MSRFLPYLGIIPALLLFSFIEIFSTSPSSPQEPHRIIFSPVLSVLPTLTVPTPSSTAVNASTSTAQTEAPAAVETKPIKKPATESPPPTQPAIAEPPKAIVLDPTVSELSISGAALKKALVNILCTAPLGSSLKSISASGVLVDPKGIILTDAHVAQYFLLGDHGVSCSIRSGSPAVDRYVAAPIFISPTWIKSNPTLLSQAAPSGTGEHDFALLAITKSSGVTALSYPFPYVSLSNSSVHKGEAVTIGSYGAQLLTFSQIISSLFPTIASTAIIDAFTFNKTSVDVIELAGTLAAQEGSSGGGVIDEEGNLVGLVTTSLIAGPIEARTTHAITASYVKADFEKETGGSFDALLALSIDSSIKAFASQIPVLEGELALPL